MVPMPPPWTGPLLARVSIGVLFALTGAGKLLVPARRAEMRRTLSQAGLPFPAVAAIVVSSIECLSGVGVMFGLLTRTFSLLLTGVMAGALWTTVLPAMKPRGLFSWITDFLYLPEVLYIVILLWLVLSGPGSVSVDHFIASVRQVQAAPAAIGQC